MYMYVSKQYVTGFVDPYVFHLKKKHQKVSKGR